MNITTKKLLNKVPEVTLYFWIIKILCTTVGETAADFLNINLNIGLTYTSLVMGGLLMVALFFQFKKNKYVPSIYWLSVTLISVVGTLITDNLTDHFGIPLLSTTIVFSIALAISFLIWYLNEKTLSVDSIFTRKREMFYWLVILFTFALGTASGDLLAEQLGLGYFISILLFAGIIAVIFFVHKQFKLNSILSFWTAYILTRPLGASIGDLLSQPTNHGGLGLGTTVTSFIFLSGILVIVIYLTVTKRDIINAQAKEEKEDTQEKNGLLKTIVVLSIFIIAGVATYSLKNVTPPHIVLLNTVSTTSTTTTSSLGDLSLFSTITQDTLTKLNAGDQTGATTRIGDLEYEWDKARARLSTIDKIEWTKIDGKIDAVLRELRSTSPNITTEKSALKALFTALGS